MSHGQGWNEPGNAPGSVKARYYDASGKVKTKTFSGKRAATEATKWRIAQVNAMNTGTYRSPEDERMTVGQVWDLYIAGHSGRPRTLKKYESNWRNHVGPRWERTELRRVTIPEAKVWVRQLQATKGNRGELLSESSVQSCFVLLYALMSFAVNEGNYLAAHPLRRMQPPKVTQPLVVPPTLEDVEAMLGELLLRHRPLLILLAGLGLRYGEGAGLTVDHLVTDDEGKLWANIDRQVHIDGVGRWRFGPPKSRGNDHGGKRRVPVVGWTEGPLREHLRRFPVIGEGFIARRADGNPIGADEFTYHLRRVQRRLWGEVRYTPHDLRHFYVSTLLAENVSMDHVQRFIGHVPGSAITSRTYGHLTPESGDRVRATFDATVARSSRKSVGQGVQKRQRNQPAHSLPTLHPPTSAPMVSEQGERGY